MGSNERVSKIKVPEGMIEAAIRNINAQDRWHGADGTVWIAPLEAARLAVEAALRWLSENPIRPTDRQVNEIWQHVCEWGSGAYADGICEWQRRMFLAEDEDEGIKDLLEPPKPPFPEGTYRSYADGDVARRVREAYRRGKEGR